MKNNFILGKEKYPQQTTWRIKSRLFNRAWLMMAVLSITIWQCKDDDYKETTGICPEVASTTPANKDINVEANTPITVTFNETMNASTITSSSFMLAEGTSSILGLKKATVAVEGTVTPASGETATFTFTPASPLAPFTLYIGTIKKGVKDPMNNMLQEDYVWSFTTKPLVSLTSNPVLGGTITGGGTYDVGTSVTSSVVANPGYVFFNWTENGEIVSTEANYAFEVEENRTLVANFTAQYNIAISSNPLLGGTSTGNGTFNSGTSVTVSAVPAIGYTFTNWTEGTTAVSVLKDYTFPINSNRVMVANFGINMYMLNVTALNGTVTKLPNQTTFSHGTSVQLTATPAVGYTFTSWTGDVTGTDNTATLIMNSEKTVTANFTAIVPQFTIELSSLPLLGGTTTGNGTFNSGTSVTVSAVPATGYTFTNWTEGTTIVSTLKDYTFPINSNRELVANFDINMYMLNVTALNGTVSKLPNQTTYSNGASVQLTATPAMGYTFTSWSGDINGTNSTATVIMNSEKNITANFTANTSQFTVELSSNPIIGGTTSGDGSFNSGASVTVSAIPASGYTFTNWTEGTNIVSSNANYNFNINANTILVANFESEVILPSGPAGIDLGSAGDFAILAGSGVSNTGVSTMINGDVGAFPTATMNGLLAGNVNGILYMAADPIVGLAKDDLTAAYNDGQARSLNAISLPGQIGGLTLAPGLYVNSSTSGISGTGPNGILTLDAGGNANAVWIFKVGSTFITDANTSIVLAGGAQAKNIYWSVGTSATLGTNSIFYGNILADQAITLTTGATLYGRALTRIAAVTLDSNIVTKP